MKKFYQNLNEKQLEIQAQIETEIEVTLEAFANGEITLDGLERAACNAALDAWQRSAYASCWSILSA